MLFDASNEISFLHLSYEILTTKSDYVKSQSTILYFMQLKQSQQLHFIQTATLRRVLYRGLARLTKTLPVRMPSQAHRIETEFEFENDTKVERHKLLHSTQLNVSIPSVNGICLFSYKTCRKQEIMLLFIRSLRFS